MTHPYRGFVESFADLLAGARALPLGGFPGPASGPASAAPVTMVFAPHPDDESIVGALPLRLLREAGHRVMVVAVTQGSRPDRQRARLEEMRGACAFLGFELITTLENGLTGINPKAREAEPGAWSEAVAIVSRILTEHRPRVVFMPHERDWNTTHIGTHLLVMDALQNCPDVPCLVVETEFWAPMANPNLLIESTVEDVADLVAALSFHKGEVARNPYHLLLPPWMADNVRRGGELVGGQGQAAPEFRFATLYRLRRRDGTGLAPAWPGGRFVPAGSDPASILG